MTACERGGIRNMCSAYSVLAAQSRRSITSSTRARNETIAAHRDPASSASRCLFIRTAAPSTYRHRGSVAHTCDGHPPPTTSLCALTRADTPGSIPDSLLLQHIALAKHRARGASRGASQRCTRTGYTIRTTGTSRFRGSHSAASAPTSAPRQRGRTSHVIPSRSQRTARTRWPAHAARSIQAATSVSSMEIQRSRRARRPTSILRVDVYASRWEQLRGSPRGSASR